MNLRSERVELPGAAAGLEVRGIAPSIALFVDGRPVSANWDALSGSILEHFYLREPVSNEDKASVVRDIVGRAPADHLTLAEQFAPILRLFPGGPYRLDYQEEGAGLIFDLPEYDSGRWARAEDSVLWHVGSDTLAAGVRALLPSQRTDAFDEQRILEWADAIGAGERPTPITATIEGANCEFILDGHHKLEAYKLAGVAARRLAIVHLAPKAITLSDWPGGRLAKPPEAWALLTRGSGLPVA